MRILAVGGAHIDRRGQVSGDYRPGVSNPGAMREDVGGGAFNALRNAVQRGASGALFSLRGGDDGGLRVAREVESWGIGDLSVTFLDRATPSYTALLDHNGDLIAGLADMAIYDLAFARQFRRRAFRDAIAGADALLVDGNVPRDGLDRIAGLLPTFAIAVSPAKVIRFRDVLPRIEVLFMNLHEARALSSMPRSDIHAVIATLRELGLTQAVITDGANGAFAFDEADLSMIAAPRVQAVDVTGAGDALAGVTLAAMLSGKPLREALREGVAAAALTVQSQHVVLRHDARSFERCLAAVAAPASDC